MLSSMVSYTQMLKKKLCTAKCQSIGYVYTCDASPGQHEAGVGVIGARACGAPFDGVDLLAVSLEIMDTGVLLHAPDLKDEDMQVRK